MKRDVKKKLYLLLSALVWILLWEGLYLLVGDDLMVASPWSVLTTALKMAGQSSFWKTVLFSMTRILAGYLLALLAGCGLAVLTCASDILNTFFQPMLRLMRATPIASFIILALVWMSKQNIPVFISFLIVLPIIWANVYAGITHTDEKLLEMANAFHVNRWRKIRAIYLPGVLPYFLSAATTSLGMAWKAGVAAEVLCTPLFSIGRELNNAKVYVETTELFAWTAVVILLSVLIEKGVVYLTHQAAKKMTGA